MVKSKKYSTQARFAPTLSPIYEENTLSISEVDLVFDEDDFILESRRQSKESAERRKLASSQKHKIRNFFVYAIILFCIVAFGFFLVRRVLEGRRKEEDFLNGKEGSIADTDIDSKSASSLDGPRLDATVGKGEPKRSKKTSTSELYINHKPCFYFVFCKCAITNSVGCHTTTAKTQIVAAASIR